MLTRFSYSLLWYLAMPLVILYFANRIRKDKAYRQGFAQRFGFFNKNLLAADKAKIHLHCASLGEAKAVLELIKQLCLHYPQHQIVITNTTPTGAVEIKRAFAQQIGNGQLIQLMAPLDLPGAVKRFCRQVKPELSLFVEVEIWPNWLAQLKKSATKLALVNARLSQKSLVKYQKYPLFSEALKRFDWIGAQTESDLAGYQRLLNGNAQTLARVGNMKFDLALPDNLVEQVIKLRRKHDLKRPIWIAASVHPDEYQQALTAHQQILNQSPDALLILVPRHKERFVEVADYLSQQAIQFKTRSSQALVSQQDSVWLIDTLGEMLLFYALADIAFVGGSLVARGGHNPLEPAALAKPICMGPENQNCVELYQQLIATGGLAKVTHSESLAQQLSFWFNQQDEREQASQAARQFIVDNQGAVARTLAQVKNLLS